MYYVLAVFRSPSKDMLKFYKSMVRSQLEYCSPLWNPVTISSIQELESVQKVFTGLNCWDTFRQLSLMSLQRSRERYIILHMWKVLHSITINDQIELKYLILFYRINALFASQITEMKINIPIW